MRHPIYTLSILLCLTAISLNAQDTIRVTVKPTVDKEEIRLRRMVNSPSAWYYTNNHGMMAGWRNSHKSIHKVYCDYWCFEAATVVQIMGLNDSELKDWEYYPKDNDIDMCMHCPSNPEPVARSIRSTG